MTSKLGFEAVVRVIGEWAFYCSPYPVILSIENHCSRQQQVKMAEILQRVLRDKLARPLPDNCSSLPSPDQLKHKILLKGSTVTATALTEEEQAAEDAWNAVLTSQAALMGGAAGDALAKSSPKSSSRVGHTLPAGKGSTEKGIAGEKPEKIAEELSQLIFLKSVHFESFVKSKQTKAFEMSSFSEGKARKLAKLSPLDYVHYNRHHLARIYPKGIRFGSSNYKPSKLWSVGCSIVALNYQVCCVCVCGVCGVCVLCGVCVCGCVCVLCGVCVCGCVCVLCGVCVDVCVCCVVCVCGCVCVLCVCGCVCVVCVLCVCVSLSLCVCVSVCVSLCVSVCVCGNIFSLYGRPDGIVANVY